MRKIIGIAILTAGCTSAPDEHKLPSATFTPHLEMQHSAIACGDDIAFYGSPTPDLHYGFAFDAANHITAANGIWLADGSTESTVYTWAGDNLTNMLWTNSWDTSQAAVVAHYDAANNLLDYTWSVASPDYTDAWTYAFSNFMGPNQPLREDILQAGQPAFGYDLVYDAFGRLSAAIPGTGPSTTWTYDDLARTITVDTGNGAFTGVMTYDAADRPLSSTWTGSDPSMIDGEEVYAWTGARLDTITYRSGSDVAPHQLELIQVDTMLYNCAMARLAGQRTPFKSPPLRGVPGVTAR